MTTPVFKLTKGARNFDLQTGRYRVYGGWAPPPVSEIPLFAEGTSANRGGAVLVDRRPVNRQMSLRLNVLGSSDAEIRRAVADLQMMLSLAGDEYEPLYLEFRPNSDTPEPLWGNYGSNLRYEIVHGAAEIEQTYLVGARLAADTDVVLTLVVKPYALGRAQRLGSALGGLVEDVIGAPDGISRGLIVPPATTNLFKDPSFELGTLATNWSVDVGAGTGTAALDTTRALMGAYSMKMVEGSVYCNVYQSITTAAASHTISAYVYKDGGGAVTSSDFRFVIDGAVVAPTAFISVGSGWYFAYRTQSETAAAHLTGVSCYGTSTIWVDCVQFEQAAIYTPYCDGNMLGCAWSGSTYSSTSTRTAARLRIPVAGQYNRTQGAVRVAWYPSAANGSISVSMLFDSASSNIRGYWNGTAFVLTDGTNTATSAAQTFSARDGIVLHFVFGPSGLAIYKNGVSIATAVSFAAPDPGTYIYIGCNSATAQHTYGALADFAIFDVELTSAQVSADATNIATLAADGQRIGAIPWLWTKDGDDVVDNCDDSTRDNWAVAGGVPGSADAETIVSLTNTNSNSYVYMVRGALPSALFNAPTAPQFYADHSGTVDANSSGGQYNALASLGNLDATPLDYRQFLNQTVNFFSRGRPTGDTALVAGIMFGAAYVASASLSVVSDADYNLYYLGSGVVGPQSILGIEILSPAITIRLLNTGNTYNSDFLLAAIGDATQVSASGFGFVLRGDSAKSTSSSPSSVGADLPVTGKRFVLEPEKINLIWLLMSATDKVMTITHTATFAFIKVTPRYQIL